MGKAVPPNLKLNVDSNVIMKKKGVTNTDIVKMERMKKTVVSIHAAANDCVISLVF